jgi:hypothetical protein
MKPETNVTAKSGWIWERRCDEYCRFSGESGKMQRI